MGLEIILEMETKADFPFKKEVAFGEQFIGCKPVSGLGASVVTLNLCAWCVSIPLMRETSILFKKTLV